MTIKPGPEPAKKSNPAAIMPANVRAGQIIGLVDVTGGLGSPIDVGRLAYEFGDDIATLLPVLDAAEMLGLVKIERGNVNQTDLGLKFQRTSKHKIRLLKEQLLLIEPFKTAVEMASKHGSVSAAEVADALVHKKIRWHHEQEVNEALVNGILIHWGIYAGILSYKSERFQKAS
jgi:NitT/TauT family transport system ATP-binding protein